jgi:predicted nucleic acid-binding Zn ribbon protein
MPVYTYRREDGTTFDIRQKFTDAPLAVDPETGQKVVRLVQRAGVIFKGSGFYVTDNKSSSNGNGNGKTSANGAHSSNGKNAEAADKSGSESTKSTENGKVTATESKSSTSAK